MARLEIVYKFTVPDKEISMSQPSTVLEWKAKAADLQIQGHAYIDGEYRAAASDQTLAALSPIDGSELARIANSGQAEVDAAVASSRRVFDAGTWSRAAPRDRKAVLFAFADAIRDS